jgi:hypothetical protein
MASKLLVKIRKDIRVHSCSFVAKNIFLRSLIVNSEDYEIPGDFRLGGFVGQSGVDQEIE